MGKFLNIKITNGNYLFHQNANIEYVYEILSLCKGLTTANYMFSGCGELTELDLSGLDTSNITEMNNMFYNCINLTTLNIKNFNTSNVVKMDYAFGSLYRLKELDLSHFDTNKVTNMANLFYLSHGLEKVNLSSFNTEKVSSMKYMFYNCSGLKELDLSSFDMSKVNNVADMFGNNNELKEIKSFKNLGKGYTSKTENYSNYKLNFSKANNLSAESLMDILENGLFDLNITYNVANGGILYRQSCELGTTNLAKLQETEEGLNAIRNATNKGWNIS